MAHNSHLFPGISGSCKKYAAERVTLLNGALAFRPVKESHWHCIALRQRICLTAVETPNALDMPENDSVLHRIQGSHITNKLLLLTKSRSRL